MFDFDSPHVNYSNEIGILIPFLAKWLSLSFDHTIFRNMGWGRRPSCHAIFRLHKKATINFNFNEFFLLAKNIRNFRINLRNKLLYSLIFIMYMRGFVPSLIPPSLH